MTKLTIKITKEVLRESMNCDKGTCNVNENCAIAVSVRNIFPKARVGALFLDFDAVGWIREGNYALLPTIARNFIETFDNSTPSERINLPEFSFDIEIPDEVVDTISIDEIKRIVQGSKTLELV